MKVSLNRQQVDAALETRGTNLSAFIEAGRAQGKTIEEIWMDLRATTGVPFAVRTFYRWARELEGASA